jgi:hypothetical protein
MAATVTAAAIPANAPGLSHFKNYLYREDEIVGDWLNVLKWCLIPILAFAVYWAIEKYFLQFSPRLVPNPAEFPTRFFGFSHYFVGSIFLLTSKRMRRIEGWVWLIALLGIGVLISVFFSHFGGERNPIMVIFYFLFFMIHGYRDMVFFYQPTLDDPISERLRSQILVLAQAALILILFYFLVPAYLLFLELKPRRYPPELQAQIDALKPFLQIALNWTWVILLASLVGLWHRVQRFPGGWKEVWSSNRAVFLVLLYTSLIILASPLVGPWTFNLLILSHFVGWYFYASRRMRTMPKQTTRADGLWRWFRGSVVGFQRLHLGAAAVFLVAIIINHFVLEGTGILNTLVSSRAFFYWTIIHVTISFAPKS